MGCQISWYEPKRVIYMRIDGDLTADVIQQAGEDLRRLIGEGSNVHLLADFTKLGTVPRSIADSRKYLGRLNGLKSSIIIGLENPIVRFMANVFGKLGGYEVRVVNNLEEAKMVVARLDPTLSHLAQQTQSASSENNSSS